MAAFGRENGLLTPCLSMPGVDPSGFMIRLIERQSMTRQRCGSPRKFRFGFASRRVSFLADLAFSPIGKTRPNIPSAVASVVSNSPLYRPERMESETFMGRIIGISGSLRRASFNSMLLRAASQLAPDGTTIEIASMRGIPLYDGDVESAEGIPAPVQELKTRIAEADGLLIVTPEYNNSIPGVLKNAIDWLSRPAVDIPKVFGGRPVAVIGATPGPAGTSLAQAAWLPVLRTLGTAPWFGGRIMASSAQGCSTIAER